jgi:PIN domain
LKQRSVNDPGPTAASGESREMKGRSRAGRRLFVLDTNVLMHDPTAIFRFEEHDVRTRRACRRPRATCAR